MPLACWPTALECEDAGQPSGHRPDYHTYVLMLRARPATIPAGDRRPTPRMSCAFSSITTGVVMHGIKNCPTATYIVLVY